MHDAREAVDTGAPNSAPLAERISNLPSGVGAGPTLLELAQAGDPLSVELVDDTLEKLSMALAAGESTSWVFDGSSSEEASV